jgi:uncharacterized SAM-binding protein YcdF (DUF218 family)
VIPPWRRAPTAARWRWLPFVLGIASVFAVRLLVNHTTWADYLVRPLVLEDTGGTGDAIVVPGAAATALCSPNLPAVRRVTLAAALFQQHRAPVMLISGGRSVGTACTVAHVMAEYAVRIGVPRDRVLTEDRSATTWENALYSAPILDRLGVRRIVLVTDRLHMLRAQRSFERLGYQVERASVPVPESIHDNVEMLNWGLREYVGLAYYHLVLFRSAVPRDQ